ncbi:MAG: type II CRISPR RNA-guided endonuclease Cas9 [Bacteroidota bacterium]
MKTILGLDLGIASIGWAIITEEKEKQNLVASGVRIIPIDTETVNNFSKGNSTSKNQDRRTKRSARRNNHRYKLRKHFLKEFLKENQLWPLPESLFHLSAVELYSIRHKAISEQISLQELARIWFHLNQKRGYISSRKAVSEDEKDTKYVEAIKQRSKSLYDNYKTVGSYFYHKLLENSIYRIKSGDDKENIFLVEDYMLEFDLIWETQKKFYPDFLTAQNHDRVKKQIIYYKRKLKSQKHLIGECRFEKYHKCMPVSSPIAEEIRLWQDVNKLRITSKLGEVFELPNEQKTNLFNYLMVNEKIIEKDIFIRYQFPTTKGEFKINYEKQIKGYSFRAKLIALFEAHGIEATPYLNFDPLANDFSAHPFFKLWHLLYSTEEIIDIKKNLKEKYQFHDELINGLLKLPIKNDFTSLSSRAARKILPHLRNGLMYDKACKEAGYNHSESLTKEENEIREIIDIENLDLIKPNELRNPTVEKILNQLINLLKALRKEGYKFDEIRIELARELKKNAKERKRISELNRENEAFTKKCREDLIKEGYGRPTKKDIEKYKLWLEFDGCSPYEPHKRIELRDLFDKAKYEIEHIIPKSRLFDDSFNNKTIARVHVNKEKDNQTALDYMCAIHNEDGLHQYTECIKHNMKISRTKRNNLLMKGNEIPEDFINRQLNETRYITSETLKLLKKVCREVNSTSGTVTDYLRHYWGYDVVLMDLNFDRVNPEEIELREINGQKKKVIKNWSKRLDNRHHAIDAIVIAATKKTYIQQLNRLNTYFDKPGDLKPIPIKTIVPFSYEEVKKNVANILVSYKAGKKVATLKKIKKDRWGKEPGNIGQKMLIPRGSLHEESVYAKNYRQKKVDIKNLESLDQCAVEWQKKVLQNYLNQNKLELSVALKQLKKKPITYGKDKKLTAVTVFDAEHVKRYDLQYSPTNKFDLKAAESIVNKNVRQIIMQRLQENNNEPAKAFKNLKENPVYFNKEKGITIKSVRCYTGGNDYPALHDAIEGNTVNHKQGIQLSNKIPVDFVKGGNNHHIALYEDLENKRLEECISFFEAFERKRNKLPIIERNHPKGWRFITSIQQNEMFVFDLDKKDLETLIEKENYAEISKHLYRVQKIQSKDYTFRHHLETKIDDTKSAKELKKFIRVQSIGNMTGIKVRVSNTNRISIIND